MSGKRGPTPQPNIIQVMKGDPGKRAKAGLEKEPRFGEFDTTCPDWFGKVEKSEWNRVIDILIDLEAKGQKLLTKADRTMLILYCVMWGEFIYSTIQLQKSGHVVPIRHPAPTDADGNPILDKEGKPREGKIKYLQQSPFVAMQRNATKMMQSLAGEFGFSPASRTRVQATVLEKQDDVEAEIFG